MSDIARDGTGNRGSFPVSDVGDPNGRAVPRSQKFLLGDRTALDMLECLIGRLTRGTAKFTWPAQIWG